MKMLFLRIPRWKLLRLRIAEFGLYKEVDYVIGFFPLSRGPLAQR